MELSLLLRRGYLPCNSTTRIIHYSRKSQGKMHTTLLNQTTTIFDEIGLKTFILNLSCGKKLTLCCLLLGNSDTNVDVAKRHGTDRNGDAGNGGPRARHCFDERRNWL